jgi:hypothetical protein
MPPAYNMGVAYPGINSPSLINPNHTWLTKVDSL